MNRNELQHVTVTVGVGDAAVGSNVPTNYTRYIYRIKIQNLNAGPQVFTLGRRENGAVATDEIDHFSLPLQHDMFTDPDEIEEDAVPIYKIGGPISLAGAAIAGPSTLRAFVDVGTAYLTVWYSDSQN